MQLSKLMSVKLVSEVTSVPLVPHVLAEAVETGSLEELANAHREWIEEALSSERHQRDEVWTKSIAVGSAEFVLKTREMLGVRGGA